MVVLRRRGRHILQLRGNGNISLDLDIERMQIITQELRLARLLNLGRVHAGFHLHVLEVRRARAGLGQEVGVADIRVDVVRGSAALGSVLAGPRREQAADDGEAGTDQADGGLDVCPEGGLVDGVCGVGRADPEEDDDAVDAGEADEGAESKDAVQGELVLPGAVQVPDHGDGEGEDHEVHEYIPGLVHDEEKVWVDALAVDAVVPVGLQWATLSGAGEENGCSPCTDETVEAEGEFLEFGRGEHSAVEADDGDFDGGAKEEVGELVGQEDLEGVRLILQVLRWCFHTFQ